MWHQWTKHLSDPVEKAKFVSEVQSCRFIFRRLIEILDDKEKEINNSETSFTDYQSPSWAYVQAHKNGYRSCLRHIKTLVDLDQQKEPVKDERNLVSGPDGKPTPRLSL